MMDPSALHAPVRALFRDAGLESTPARLSASERSALSALRSRARSVGNVHRLLPVAGAAEWAAPPERGPLS